MSFRIGDVVIGVIGRGGLIREQDGGSGEPGTPDPPSPPDPPSTPPGEPGGPPPPGPDAFVWGKDFSSLQLRTLLQSALEQLGGPLSAEEMMPQEVQDLEQLEKDLTVALKDLHAMKKRFQ